MVYLELLAPARNADIGIAAIDCGADAVYIAGPDFGARKDAGNPVGEVARLCGYAHRFGARVFVTFNILLRDEEMDRVHDQMVLCQQAGADAFIIRDPRICDWKDITVPLHASTQCSIRDVSRALEYEAAGCSRIILERELSLDQVREICSAVSCEVEFFVHGALCVCYSGQCTLSEELTGRSADRGECIQACRNLYDLVDSEGKVLVKDKALLSLKDFNLSGRLESLAEAGVCSFKIEGRLKNASYVRNVVRDYDLKLQALVQSNPDKYCRASFGRPESGFQPSVDKTFNRGYTELYIDSERGQWSCMNAPKSMGEELGRVKAVRPLGKSGMVVELERSSKPLNLRNGDGFAFVSRGSIIGFRADVCEGLSIRSRMVPQLSAGTLLYRNISAAFEKQMDANPCVRYIPVSLSASLPDSGLEIHAVSEDGRRASVLLSSDQIATNRDRAASLISAQLSKRSGIYSFSLDSSTLPEVLPHLGAAVLNSARRELAAKLDELGIISRPLLNETQRKGFSASTGRREGELMRSKYCIRYELGLCPVHQGAKAPKPLFLLNNGRRFALRFDCAKCEMALVRD